ncbi:cation diffusion facilitator family transporter [Bacillus sp. SCS-153A]|uniref:cation diffusion facilitator family transporter n=1 Tax=Rossellomorea sedimentorum TaxID=3115294 RepID=UPI003905A278
MSDKHSSVKNTKVAFFINLFFAIIEFIGGLMTNSMAILSDAVHDLGDSLSLGSSWYLEKLSKKGKNSQFSFGHRRFSLLGALINGIILIVGSLLVLYESFPRLLNPQHPNAQGMIWLAILGITLNSIAAYRLHKGSSMNESILSWHMLEDILGWVGVLIVSIVLMFKDIHILDPILAISIAAFVLYNAVKKTVKTMKIFLDGVPEGINLDAVEKDMKEIEGVESISHLHIWSIDGEKNAMSAHVQLQEGLKAGEAKLIKEKIRNQLSSCNLTHSTIEIHHT